MSLQCRDSDSGLEGRGSQIAGVEVGCGQENPKPVIQDRRDRMNKIRQLLWNVISTGLPSSSDIEVLRKMVLLNLMFLFGGTCLFLFIFVAYAKEDLLLAAVDSTVLAFLIALFVYLRKTGNYRRTGALGTTATGLFFTFQIAYGAMNQTAFIWSLTYPLIAIFLLGLKRGVQMSLLLLALAIAIFILGKEVSWLAVYQTDVIVRFIPAYLIIFFFSFSIEKVRDTVHGRLEVSNRELWVEITERKRAEEALTNEKQRFETLSKNAPFGLVMIGQDGTFRYISRKFRELFGYDLEDVPNGKAWFQKAFPDPKYRHEVISTWLRDLESLKPGEKRLRIFTVTCNDGTEKIINFIPVQLGTGENLMTYEDITERKWAEEEREKLVRDLQGALSKVKTLSGMLPICASCKKIRDDKGYWSQVEVYIGSHSEAEFSHGICPDCMKKLYPDFADEEK